MSNGLMLSGSPRLMSALPFTNAAAHAAQPSRAASSNAVNPPSGRFWARGSAVTRRSQARMEERALGSAPLRIRNWTISD